MSWPQFDMLDSETCLCFQAAVFYRRGPGMALINHGNNISEIFACFFAGYLSGLTF